MAAAAYPSFPCPHCAFAVPSSMPPGMQFPCPGCQVAIVSPATSGVSAAQAAEYQAWALQHGNTAAALADASAATNDPRRANFASTSNQVAITTADGRDLVVGTQVDQQGRWAIRAQDMATGQIAWETPYDYELHTCPGLREIALRENVLFIALPQRFCAFDPATGRKYWEAPLQSPPELENSDLFGDEMRLVATAGVAVLTTDDDQWIAFAIQNGQVLWQRPKEGRVRIAPGVGFWLECEDGAELVNPSGQVVASFRGDEYEGSCVTPSYVALKVSGYNGNDQDEGLLLVNKADGQIVRYMSAPGIEVDEDDRNIQQYGQAVVGYTNGNWGKSAVYVIDPQGPEPANGPGFIAKLLGNTATKPWAKSAGGDMFSVLRMSQDALCVEVTPPDGGQHSVKILDPQSLAVRYDSGALPYETCDSHLTVAGTFAVYLVPLNADHNQYEEVCVHTTTGQEAWRKPVGHYSEHAMLGSRVLFYYDTNIMIVNVADGGPVATYPAG